MCDKHELEGKFEPKTFEEEIYENYLQWKRIWGKSKN